MKTTRSLADLKYYWLPLARLAWFNVLEMAGSHLAYQNSETVISETISLPAEDVWNRLTRFEAYPRYFNEIKRAKVTRLGESLVWVAWEACMDDAHFEWNDMILLNKSTYSLFFGSTSGDFDHYTRIVSLDARKTDTLVKQAIKVRFNTGLLDRFTRDLIRNKIVQLNQNLLHQTRNIRKEDLECSA